MRESVKLGDCEFAFDVHDVLDYTAYESAFIRLKQDMDGLRREGLGEAAKKLAFCAAVFDFFDICLGPGSSREIFGERANVYDCAQRLTEFLDQCKRLATRARP